MTPNNRLPWTQEEESQLIYRFRCGAKLSTMVEEFGRTQSSIIGRLRKLDEIIDDRGRIYARPKTMWADTRKQ